MPDILRAESNQIDLFSNLEQYTLDGEGEEQRIALKAAKEISADSLQSPHDETYAGEQDKDIHYTGFPGKKGRYDYERTDAGVVVTERESGERQQAEASA